MTQNCRLTDRVYKRVGGAGWFGAKGGHFRCGGGRVGRRGPGDQAQPTAEATFCHLLSSAFLPGFPTKPPGKPVSPPHGCWRFGSFNNCVLSSASRGAQAQTERPRVIPLGSWV